MTNGYEQATRMNHEAEPRVEDSFVVLDLDRTLLDSDRLIGLTCAMLTRFGISEMEARECEAMIRAAHGQSLSTLGFLSGRFGETVTAQVIAELEMLAKRGELEDENLLYGGASAMLLDELEARDVPFAVLTYGEPANQRFKLSLYRTMTGRDETTLPAVVTNQPRKGEWIHEHWSDDESDHMLVPAEFTHEAPVLARQVIIVDDKLANLESPDEAVVGIHVDNRSDTEPKGWRLSELVHELREGRELADIAQHHRAA